MLPTASNDVRAPNYGNPRWDIVYDVNAAYPENEGWSRESSGTTARAIEYHNQLLNITMTGAGTDYELYKISVPDSSFLFAEARFDMSSNVVPTLEFNNTVDTWNQAHIVISSTYIEVAIYNPDAAAVETVNHYEEDIIGSNHTYALAVFSTETETILQAYYDGNLIVELDVNGDLEFNQFWWESRDSGGGSNYQSWDYVAVATNDLTDTIDDLQDEIDELKRELERLKKQTNPDVITNQTELPTIPSRDGGIDDNVQFVDPYRTVVYTVNAAPASGSSIALYLPYPSSAEETTCIRDDLWIGGSYTRIWINDTVGSTELLNTTDAYAYFNLQYCYNATVETSGGDIIINRIVDVRLIDSFDWGWNRDSGLFSHRSTIENELAYNMENVRIYWAFPYEDEDGVSINVEGSSIEVWDDDNNLQLDQGRHYEATEIGGIALEVRWVNTSGTTEIRTYLIQFTRASHVETESYYTVYDTEISVSDTYEDAPYTVNVHHTSPGTANFEGKIIVRFQLSGQYAGKKLDVNNLYIKRSDSSLFQEFTYDSISNELRITDQSISAGESVTYTLYWDWYDEQSAIQTLILGDPLVLYSLLLLAGFAGLFIFLDATKEEKRRKYAGILIIAIDVIILIIILIA
jgi:hypothetical protein